jgi:hypothetical protein
MSFFISLINEVNCMMIRSILLVGCLLLLSCEKNIDVDLDQAADVLVVDAQIENNKPPIVVLSKSLEYFSGITPDILVSSFVHDADVFVSNGTLTHKLKEYSYELVPGYSAYYYSIDSASLPTAFTGELNKQYQLRIVADGEEYTSSVRIPSLATYPDSLWFERAPMNPDSNTRVMYIRATDPRGFGNNVRYFTQKNSEPFYPGENSVYNDQVIDGSTYQIILPQGIYKNDPPKPDSNFFKRGDTVTLKFCNIDNATYTFWNTWEFAFQGIGNPFAQPNTVLGNISNGALGAFCGYAAWYRTKIVE